MHPASNGRTPLNQDFAEVMGSLGIHPELRRLPEILTKSDGSFGTDAPPFVHNCLQSRHRKTGILGDLPHGQPQFLNVLVQQGTRVGRNPVCGISDPLAPELCRHKFGNRDAASLYKRNRKNRRDCNRSVRFRDHLQQDFSA